MSWNVRPILSALVRNPTGAVLVALQVAIALAVLVNAVYVVKQRVDKIGRDPGLDVPNLFVVASLGFARDYDHAATVERDLAYLRSVPGVVSASQVSSLPLSNSGMGVAAFTTPEPGEGPPANLVQVDEAALEAFGVKLAAGRNFYASEVQPPSDGQPYTGQVIVTRALAEALYPGVNAVGKPAYDNLGRPSTIVGIVEHMHASWVDWDKIDHVMLVPRRAAGPRATYVVRTQPGLRDEVMRAVESQIMSSDPTRMVSPLRSYEQIAERAYLADRNMAIFLVGVTTALLGITALGIFGLVTFNVGTRTRQIGTRRAVGARRRDVVRHFLLENWLVTTAGVVAGCGMALGVGYWLSTRFQLPRLDLYFLVGGVLVVWVVGLLSAWQPARRAAAVSPSVATRTV